MRSLVYFILILSVYFLTIHEVISYIDCCLPGNTKCCCKTPSGDQKEIFLDLWPFQSWHDRIDFAINYRMNTGNNGTDKKWRNYYCDTWGKSMWGYCRTGK